MKCIHCGQEIREGAKFCLYCGQPQVMPEKEQATEPMTQSLLQEEMEQPTQPMAEQPAMAVPETEPVVQKPVYMQPQQPVQMQQPHYQQPQQRMQPQQNYYPKGQGNQQLYYQQPRVNPYVPMEEEEEATGSSSKIVKILAIAVGALVVILLIVIGLMFFLKGRENVRSQNSSVYREEDEEEIKKGRDEEKDDPAKGDSEEEMTLGGMFGSNEASDAQAESTLTEAAAAQEPAEESLVASEESSAVESSETLEASQEVKEETEALPPLSAELLSGPLYGMTKLRPTDLDCSMEFIKPEEDYYFPVDYLVDGDIFTNWQVYHDDGEPVGEWAKLIFDQEVEISYMELWLGYATSEWGYYANSRPKELIIEFSTGESITVEFADARDWQYLQLSRPVKATSVTFTIKSLYVGNEWTDNAISEIAVYSN